MQQWVGVVKLIQHMCVGFGFFYIKNEVNTGVANDINEGFV